MTLGQEIGALIGVMFLIAVLIELGLEWLKRRRK